MDEFLMKWTLSDIIESWNEAPHAPTPEEETVVSILLLIENNADDLLIFSNKYACADAAFIAGLYALDAMRKRGVPSSVQSGFIRKLRLSSCRLFDIPAEELEKLMENRLGVFSPLIRGAKSLTSIVEEAALLFAYDLKYDRYVDFRADSPVVLLDFSTQIQIERELTVYFQTVFPLVMECVSKCGAPKSAVPAAQPSAVYAPPRSSPPTAVRKRDSGFLPEIRRWFSNLSWNTKCFLGLALVVAAAMLVNLWVRSDIETSVPQETTTQAAETTAPDLIEQPRPSNGRIFENLTIDGCAPFSVSGSSDIYLVLEPVDLSDSIENGIGQYRVHMAETYSDLRVFVRSGMTFETDVPLGRYEVYYAAGDTWYGEEHLFGPDTRYYKCDGYFDFTMDSEGYNGWTLTLTAVYNGNLDTDLVDEGDFPK